MITGPLPTTVDDMETETFEVARRLVEGFPKNPNALSLMANVQSQYDHTSEAEKWWRRSLEQDPEHANSHFGLSAIAMKKGEFEKAAELWRKLEEIHPDAPGFHCRHGEALLEAGEYQEAISLLHQEIAISPNNGESYFLLGRAYLQLKAYEKAAENYERAHEIKPDESRTCYGLSVAYARLGQTDKAAQFREKFDKLRATEDRAISKRRATSFNLDWATQVLARTHTGAGIVHSRAGQWTEAEAHWRRAARIGPNSRACRHELADLYEKSGHLAEAVEICEQLRRIDPGVADYHLTAGILHARLRHWNTAEEALRKTIELAPEEPDAYRNLVQVLVTANRKLSEAKAVARKLTELEPNAANFFGLGQVCERHGDLVDALAAMQRAAELAPDSEEIAKACRRLRQRQ